MDELSAGERALLVELLRRAATPTAVVREALAADECEIELTYRHRGSGRGKTVITVRDDGKRRRERKGFETVATGETQRDAIRQARELAGRGDGPLH